MTSSTPWPTRSGIERRWFQGDHYDVPEDYRERAIALGAVPVTSRELIRRLLDSGLRQRKRHREIPG